MSACILLSTRNAVSCNKPTGTRVSHVIMSVHQLAARYMAVESGRLLHLGDPYPLHG